MILILSLALSSKVFAQTPPVVTVSTASAFFCKVDQFSSKNAKPKAFKRCDSLVEANDRPIKGAEDCKEHGLSKGRECLKISGADQLSVKVKFTEKFGQNQNSSSFTCELDKSGGSACP